MAEYHHFVREDGTVVNVAWTTRSDGDFHVDNADVAARRSAVMAGPWAVVRQVHGNAVADAADCLAGGVLVEADGIVTSQMSQPISVQGADCAPIAFITNRGPIGVAHAGWRGLAAGVIRSVTERLAGWDATVEKAIIGPVICTDCYEFGSDDLDHVASELGDEVRATTKEGTPALDMSAGIVAAFDAVDVGEVLFVGGCSACGGRGFSHRARHERERHCLVAQILPASNADAASHVE